MDRVLTATEPETPSVQESAPLNQANEASASSALIAMETPSVPMLQDLPGGVSQPSYSRSTKPAGVPTHPSPHMIAKHTAGKLPERKCGSHYCGLSVASGLLSFQLHYYATYTG